MGRSTLRVCRSCTPSRWGGARAKYFTGEELYQQVKQALVTFNAADVVELEGVDCLDVCHDPCVAELSAKGHEPVTLIELHAVREAAGLVQAARSLAALPAGTPLLPHRLPGRVKD